jgi:hypothetical protein
MKIILGVGGVLCMILAWVATNLHDNGPAP